MDTKRRLLVSLSLSLIILVAVIGVLMGSVQTLLDRPIKQVKVSGALQYVSNKQIQQQLEFLVTQSFIALDLPKVKEGLEKQPWIASVALSRRWPDELSVLITEQVPVAQWLNTGFINEAGQVVDLPKNERNLLRHLPAISGNPENSAELLAFMQEIKPLFADRQWNIVGFSDAQHSGRKVSVIQSPSTEDPQTHTPNVINIDFFLPAFLAKPRLQSCLEALKSPSLVAKLSSIEAIDLRYTDGFSIHWKSKSASLEAG